MEEGACQRGGTIDLLSGEVIQEIMVHSKMSGKRKIGCVIVTYNPQIDRLSKVIDSAAKQVTKLVIVDNQSINLDSISRLLGDRDIFLIRLPTNRGIAAAMNLGVKFLVRQQVDYILTLDHDTILFENAIDEVICSAQRSFEYIDRKVLVIADTTDRNSDYATFKRVDYCITSGNIIPVDLFDQISYREELFIDEVDTDFCYESRTHGYELWLFNRKLMSHRLGETYDLRSSRLAFLFRGAFALLRREPPQFVAFEQTHRVYYMVRNSILLYKEGKISLSCLISHISLVVPTFILLDDRSSFLRMVFQGVIDAVDNNLGMFEG